MITTLKKVAILLLMVGTVLGPYLPFAQAVVTGNGAVASMAADGGGSSGSSGGSAGGSGSGRSINVKRAPLIADIVPEDGIPTKGAANTKNAQLIAEAMDGATFNTDPLDKPTLRVSNFTQNPNCNTCWSNAVEAHDGDIISFVIYYHNTSNVNALNTRMNIVNTMNYGSQAVNAVAKLWADNATPVYGNTNIYVQGNPLQPWTMTYQSAFWYPNQDPTSTDPLPNGQTGVEVTTAQGVNIGTVTPGWPSQGYLVVRYTFNATHQTSGAPVVATLPATNVLQNSATLHASVDPNGAVPTTYWFEYGTTQSLGNSTAHIQIQTAQQDVQAALSGLAAFTSYYYRVVAQNANGTTYGAVGSFKTQQQGGNTAPSVETLAASSISQNSATLNGRVNPNGFATTYWFEYGTTQSLGNRTAVVQAGSGTSYQSAFAQLSGLTPNTQYYYRIVANNTNGNAFGAVVGFVTTSGGGTGGSPEVATLSATNVSQTSAVLNGSVDPNGAATTYWFEYGTSQSLGNSTQEFSVGSGKEVRVSQSLNGLQAGTTYYFRIVGQNSAGVSRGSILSFVTSGGSGGSAPFVETSLASDVTRNSATLNGRVGPNGFITTYWFEYGTTQSLGNKTPTIKIGGTNTISAVSAALSGLTPNTQYYYRIVATNANGTSYGSVIGFTTSGAAFVGAPTAQTNAATEITQTTARLNGQVNPNNLATTYWFEYGTTQSLGRKTSELSIGSGQDPIAVSQVISHLDANTTYYFRVAAHNDQGTTYGSILSFNTLPSGNGGGGGGGGGSGGGGPLVQTDNSSNVSANQATLYGSILTNGAVSYAWFEYGTDRNALSKRTGEQTMQNNTTFQSFSNTVSDIEAGKTYYFRAAGRNSFGTSYGNILSFNTFGSGTSGNVPLVTTRPATLVSQNAALLNALVNPRGVDNAIAWFEYGPTAALGSRTITVPLGSGTQDATVSAAATGLLPNTTYFFRAVAQNKYGTMYGLILGFTTNASGSITGGGTRNPIIINTTSFASAQSCVLIVPTLSKNELGAGEEFTYTLTYRNGCSFDLSNAYVKVILPTEVEFISTSYPFLERDANGLTYNLGSVPQGAQNSITIEGKVTNGAAKGDILIFSSVLNYEDNKSRPQSISSYITATVTSERSLTASIFDAFRNLFGTWWFSLLLLLIILFLIWWIFFRRRDDEKEEGEVDVLKA